MIACLSFSESKYKVVLFEKWSANKKILWIGVCSSVGHISSIGCKSEGGGIFELNLWLCKIAWISLYTISEIKVM